ncbi:MAG: Hsp20/alpha crystallin family protein [candidate division WOR-3 bacterium]|nr:MAG: Hsp20/alpha crystallin family protein [candidate division WOR-3 bacterium]
MADKKMRRWEPFRELVSLRDDMDRLFRSFFGGPLEEVEGFWAPVIDIEEDNDSYYVRAEVPGIKKEEIKISVRGNALSLSGERKQESETKNKTFHRVERSYGRFKRTISLPSEIDAEKVKATYKDGILTVTLPKPESTKPKEIEVEIK